MSAFESSHFSLLIQHFQIAVWRPWRTGPWAQTRVHSWLPLWLGACSCSSILLLPLPEDFTAVHIRPVHSINLTLQAFLLCQPRIPPHPLFPWSNCSCHCYFPVYMYVQLCVCTFLRHIYHLRFFFFYLVFSLAVPLGSHRPNTVPSGRPETQPFQSIAM